MKVPKGKKVYIGKKVFKEGDELPQGFIIETEIKKPINSYSKKDDSEA